MRTLRIGATKFRIRFMPKKPKSKLSAWIEFDPPIIFLDRTLDQEEAALYLLHEVLHGIIADRDPHSSSLRGLEERVVESLSRGLLRVFMDNPKLLSFLKKALL